MSANLRTPKKSTLTLKPTRNSSSNSKKNQYCCNEIQFNKYAKIKVFFPIKKDNPEKENLYVKNLKKNIKKELFEGKNEDFIENNEIDHRLEIDQMDANKNENDKIPKISKINNNTKEIHFNEKKQMFNKNIHEEKKTKNFNINETEITKRDGKYFSNNQTDAKILEKFKDNFLFKEKYFKLFIEYMDMEDLCKLQKVCKKFFFSNFKSIIKTRLCELIMKVNFLISLVILYTGQ